MAPTEPDAPDREEPGVHLWQLGTPGLEVLRRLEDGLEAFELTSFRENQLLESPELLNPARVPPISPSMASPSSSSPDLARPCEI